MKLGLSCMNILRHYGYEKGLEMVKEAGFDTVDLSIHSLWSDPEGIFHKSEDEIMSFFYGIRKKCDDVELEITQTHGLCTPASPDKERYEQLKEGSELMIKGTSLLGAPYCTFHNVTCKVWEEVSLEPEFLLAENKKFFDDFLSLICEKYDVSFSMETHGRSVITTGSVLDFMGDVKNLRKSFDMIESDRKAFCLDTGHTNEAHYYGAEYTVHEAIKILGSDIKTLHLHDNPGIYDAHLPPLHRKSGVDWVQVFDALDEIGYEGSYNWELSLKGYGTYLDKALTFFGGYLRDFVEKRGRTAFRLP